MSNLKEWAAAAAGFAIGLAGSSSQSNQLRPNQPNNFIAMAKTLNPPSFQNKVEGQGGHARGARGGERGGRRGEGNDNGSGSDDDDDFDPKAESDPTWNYKYNGEKIYKIGDQCYMRDKAGHAGSYWKVFKHYKSKLVLSHALKKNGKRLNKHESNEGLTIWKNDLVGYTRKNRP